jgi:hypothetical protein
MPLLGTMKCHQRTDFACAPFLESTAFLCIPACVSDEQCGHGLNCNPRDGECTAGKPSGSASGEPCDPTGRIDPCRGFCLGTSTSDMHAGICAEVCAGEQPCMVVDGKPHGGCYGQFASQSDFGIGDIGYCNANCNCTTDCPIPGDLCRAWSDPTLEQEFGAPGLCYPILTGSPELGCSTGGEGGGGG